MVEHIDETTVGDLYGTRIALGTMVFQGTYQTADGAEAQGLAGCLAMPDGSSVWVGLDSEVVVDQRRWRVTSIEKARGELGSVSLTLQT